MKGKIILLVVLSLLMVSCGSNKKQKLYVYNWTDYIDPELIKEFEKEYNCEVVYDTYNSNENMLTKIMNSTVSYDIVCPSTDHVVIMIQQNLLEKLDKSKLPDYKNLDTTILNKCKIFDPDNQYAVPYFWGTTGIIYNKNKIFDKILEDVSWDIFADLKYKKKVSMLDDMRVVIGTALLAAGCNYNDASQEAIAKAREHLLKWDENVLHYDSEAYKNEIQDGTVYFAQAYSGDALQIMDQNENIGFTLPKEGAELWIDSWVILKNSENKDLAHKFINFILLNKENAKRNAEFVKYATPNKEAYNLLPEEMKNNKIIYPSNEYLNKCDITRNVGEKIKNMNKLWEEIRNN
ncbi:MAG TPA: spermidine/putrescine ABC transporter substrate-binding protein [Ignavibacteriales bacterium]|nr:spermidine/putrescine ABC transporter substrate-binding protein [Ignavibacteriales bacterium]HOL82152.1 spermidine/putrescine ABC transporter substrate-binding protein [Ignavibacteriales bacterium]HOM65732.1 spermidine/putrescine ABC transporter substrate-binding protein [Ignavibacteriales bacterium]HPD67587.1 spermidine/putrescine ABC transporter substrate-binding protein [Ignavibacteriales bacterium]HPP34280.1 spermidine/putrescine ABC transporter substrate-binding protein [Ignavibacterial